MADTFEEALDDLVTEWCGDPTAELIIVLQAKVDALMEWSRPDEPVDE